MRCHLFLKSFGEVSKVYTSYWVAQNIWPTLYLVKFHFEQDCSFKQAQEGKSLFVLNSQGTQ